MSTQRNVPSRTGANALHAERSEAGVTGIALRVGYRILLVVALPAVLVTVWWFVSKESKDFYQPPLSAILTAFGDTWFSDRIVTDLLPSLGRLGLGFGLALLLGAGLGVLIGLHWTVRAVLEPVLELLRAIPPPLLVPILMLFAGIGDEMKILVIVSGCVWPVLLNTVEGVRAIDSVLIETCRSYRIGGRRRLWHLVLRSASPQIVTGARQALSIGIILMVISEMYAANSGVGFKIVEFQRTFQIPEMWSGVILLGLVGVALAMLFRLAERWILRWYHGVRATQRER